MNSPMWTVLGVVIGAVVAFGLGLVWIQSAPDNGFGDLAAATVTVVFLVPIGAVVGGFIGHRRGRRARTG